MREVLSGCVVDKHGHTKDSIASGREDDKVFPGRPRARFASLCGKCALYFIPFWCLWPEDCSPTEAAPWLPRLANPASLFRCV